ncbi:uncharacterized protein LOC132550983 [Ylistrum balloti]|uniref:uncharacterized protein LOC132550983 n=1 Tax=Ylistrum balloti TaxID=509963 RepID=UPI00290583F0|nr:uncharacterized protein LOC132550983 [Ylistrum balloti]
MGTKHLADSEKDNDPNTMEPWIYILASFLFLSFVISEWSNMTLLYSIYTKKLNTVSALLVKCMVLCGTLNGILFIVPAGITVVREIGKISHDGCIYYNLVLQTSSSANRLLLLLLVLEQFFSLISRRVLPLHRYAISTVLFVIFLYSVLVSTLTVIRGDKYITRSNVYFCLLPFDWLTIAFETVSYIIPGACILGISLSATFFTNAGLKHRASGNNGVTTSTDVSSSLPPKVSVSTTNIPIARIAIPLSSLCIFASLMRLFGIVFSYYPLILTFALICDTITYAVQPLAFLCAGSFIKKNKTESVIIQFSRATTSVQVPSPAHTTNEILPSIPTVSGSLTTDKDNVNESVVHLRLINMKEDVAISKSEKAVSFTIPQNTEHQKTFELPLGACSRKSSFVEFGPSSGLHRYVSACSPSSVNIEIDDIEEDIPKESFVDETSKKVQQHSINESLCITYPHKQINCSTSQSYSRTSSTSSRSRSFGMHHGDKSGMDSDYVIPSVHVDSIDIASSKQYSISMTRKGHFTESGTSQRENSLCFFGSQNFMRKESDTGEFVVRKH